MTPVPPSRPDVPQTRPDYLRAVPPSTDTAEARAFPPTVNPGADPSVATAPPSDAPARAGRYRIEAEIGRGGMGLVLRAFDPDCHRALAVKVLRPDCRDRPELLRRFLEEAQLTAQMQHPGVPPVYEIGELEDGRPFFAMKLVKGQTLAELLQGRQSPAHELSRFVLIFGQVCQTLAYAHSKGILHRDLKPSNGMVGAFGEVQVMDWGLAKLISRTGDREATAVALPREQSTVYSVRSEAAEPWSVAGDAAGTPAFMAPEQARGEVGQLDERCDVFG